MAVLSHSQSPVVSMTFLTLAMMGVFGAQGVFFAMIIEALSGVGNRLSLAAGLAIVTTCGNVGGFVGPYGIGLFVSAFGDFKFALLAVSMVFLSAALLVALCGRRMLGTAVLAASFRGAL